MTTIAYKDGVIAQDNRVSSGGHALPGIRIKKAFKTPNGLLAFSGDADMSIINADRAKEVQDVTAVLNLCIEMAEAGSDNEVMYIQASSPRVVHLFDTSPADKDKGTAAAAEMISITLDRGSGCAIGSGSMYAMVAMRCGASAEEAVVRAAEVDVFTDARVTTLSF